SWSGGSAPWTSINRWPCEAPDFVLRPQILNSSVAPVPAESGNTQQNRDLCNKEEEKTTPLARYTASGAFFEPGCGFAKRRNAVSHKVLLPTFLSRKVGACLKPYFFWCSRPRRGREHQKRIGS